MDNIKNMNLEQIEQRKSAIKTEITEKADTADLDALEKELDALDARQKTLIANGEKRKSMLQRIGDTADISAKGTDFFSQEVEPEGIDSKAYHDAFFKHLNGDELSSKEMKTLVTGITGTTSGSSTVVTDQSLLVPTETVNKIWDLVSKKHSILDDIQIYHSGVVMTFIAHTSGDGASIVQEGSAPSEESNTFAKVTLAGKDFAKYVDVSYAMGKMAIPALEQYLINEISKALGDKLAQDAVDTIINSIASDNKDSVATPDYGDICDMFGNIERADDVVIYARRKTIYSKLVGMTTTDGKPVFQLAPAEKAVGTILGALIKVEDAVPTGGILIGDGNSAVMNVIQDIMIETDRDIKKHVTTYSGYTRAETALLDDKAFSYLAQATVSG